MVQHRAKRKSGPSLTEKLSVMEDLLATSQDELQLAEAEHQQLEWKELVSGNCLCASFKHSMANRREVLAVLSNGSGLVER